MSVSASNVAFEDRYTLPVIERIGDSPEEIRQKVRQLKTDGADVIKIFASASIRDGGKQTMTDAQLQAVCGEANALGMRPILGRGFRHAGVGKSVAKFGSYCRGFLRGNANGGEVERRSPGCHSRRTRSSVWGPLV